jgi:transcriptional regulator GlxA family with amidase domain
MIMRENLENPLSPSVVAESAGLSTRQLERLFQRYVGTSPKNYMTRLRLERARTLLQQTDMRVLDVAIACGFGSASYFSKCFRRYFGTSPHMQQKSV